MKSGSALLLPADSRLYERVKSEAKKRFSVWPSAYASGWLVKEYKRRFKEQHGSHSSPYQASKKDKREHLHLTRWFQEDWRNVCERDDAGNYVPCGRRVAASTEKYPYCRPRYRVSNQTPKTISEMSKSELRQMCSKKRKSPTSRVYVL